MPYKKCFKNISEYHGTNSGSYYKNSVLPKETEYIVEDGSNLPFPDQSFEVVLNFQVLPVFNDMNKFYNEVYRVLKPNGYFLLTSDFLYPIWNAPNNYWRTTQFGLEELAKNSLFKTEIIYNYGGFWAMMARVFPRYIRGLFFKFIQSYRSEKRYFIKIIKLLRILGWLPFAVIMPIILNISIFILHFLDKIMKDADFTTNYMVLMQKIEVK